MRLNQYLAHAGICSRREADQLIEAGVDLNINPGASSTALTTASELGHTEIVKLLIKAGADVNIKDEYKSACYELPQLVFWDLEAHAGQPAECSDENVAMISGFSPAIMKAVLNAEEFNPIDVMLEALEPIKLDNTNLKPELEIDYGREI